MRTKDDKSGSIGPSAAELKKRELELLRAGGLEIVFGFGNRSTDVDAYAAYVAPTHRYFVGLEDHPPGAPRGGRGFRVLHRPALRARPGADGLTLSRVV